jgi:hypothetical protein
MPDGVVNSQKVTRVESKPELSPELKEFIDQLIVPLLVERLLAETRHLYSNVEARYDTASSFTRAAQEAA